MLSTIPPLEVPSVLVKIMPVKFSASLNIRYESRNYGFKNSRFAISTMVPKNKVEYLLFLARQFRESCLDLKIHYSLHSTSDVQRKELIPNSASLNLVLEILKYIKEQYNTKIEIHYSLIKEVNDSGRDIAFLNKHNLPVKFLKLAESEQNNFIGISQEEYKKIRDEQIVFESEYYEPPGSDIGASCGQINLYRYI